MRIVAAGLFLAAVLPQPAFARDPDCPECPLGYYDAREHLSGRDRADPIRQMEERQKAVDRAIKLLMAPESLPWEEQPNDVISTLEALGLAECVAADPALLALGKTDAPEARKGSAVACRLGNVSWVVRYRWIGNNPPSAYLQDHVLAFATAAECRRVQAALARSPFTAAPQSGPEYRARLFRVHDRERVLLVNPQCNASHARLTLTSWLNDQ